MTETTIARRPRPHRRRPSPARMDLAAARDTAAGWLARHSIDILRVNLGLVFLGFGVLKFVPGLSPAEGLVVRTIDALTLGLVTSGITCRNSVNQRVAGTRSTA